MNTGSLGGAGLPVLRCHQPHCALRMRLSGIITGLAAEPRRRGDGAGVASAQSFGGPGHYARAGHGGAVGTAGLPAPGAQRTCRVNQRASPQACIDENFDMVRFLVESGADVDRQDNEGWTPLHAAASCGHLNIAE